jgi:hypothetical protein
MVLDIEIPITCASTVFETDPITAGMCKEVPGIGILRLHPMPQEERARGLAYDSMPLLTVAASLAASTAVNIFSSWLYDRLKGSAVRRIRINRRTVEVTPDGIRKAVELAIEIEEH